MVRPYLNKSDHEEYLRQFQAERNKRLKKRLLIAAATCLVLVSVYFSIFGLSSPTPDSFPAYLGGESENMPTEVRKELDSQEPVVAEEDTESQKQDLLPGIGDDSSEIQLEETEPSQEKEEEANQPDNLNLEASDIQSQNLNLANSQQEVARRPFAEKVSDRTGMQKNPELSAASILFSAEKMPKFPGGYSALKKYIKRSLQVPEEAKKQEIKGTVQVQFIVEVNGSIQSPRIAKGLGHGCDEAALSLVKGMPKWIPGKHNGEEVAVYYNLPIKF